MYHRLGVSPSFGASNRLMTACPMDSTPQGSAGPRTIGKYQVLGVLGRGSMGVVYKAEDPEIGRVVAIKTLRKVHGPSTNAVQSALDRFKQEARSAGRLRHPNIITIFDANSDDGMPFIVMDFIEGQGLDAVIQNHGRLTPHETIHFLRQIADGLDYAHSMGVLHRDIKPSNILIDGSGRAFVLDFGVASLTSSTAPGAAVVGTPGYMAPEQIQNEPLDNRCDLFSLGVVAFEALSGSRPFAGDNVAAVIQSILQGKRSSLQGLAPDLPLQAELEIDRMLASDRAKRFPTAREFINALAAGLGVEPSAATKSDSKALVRRRKPSLWRPFHLPGAPRPESNLPEAVARRRRPSLEFLSLRTPPKGALTDVTPSVGAPAQEPLVSEPVADLIASQRRGGLFWAACFLAAGSIVLAIFLAVRLSRVDPPAVVVLPPNADAADSLAPLGEPGPLQLPAVAPAPEGVSVHQMTDEQLLGVLVGGGMAEEQVLEALREGRGRRIVGLVEGAVHALRSDSYIVQIETLKLLGEIGDRRAVPEIVVVLDDEDPMVREHAARALGVLADARALGYLSSRLVREEVPSVKQAIKGAIDRIHGFSS